MRPCAAGDFVAVTSHDTAAAAMADAARAAGRGLPRRIVAPTPTDVDCLPDVGFRARLTPPRLIER